jgi:hypothetical protein
MKEGVDKKPKGILGGIGDTVRHYVPQSNWGKGLFIAANLFAAVPVFGNIAMAGVGAYLGYKNAQAKEEGRSKFVRALIGASIGFAAAQALGPAISTTTGVAVGVAGAGVVGRKVYSKYQERKAARIQAGANQQQMNQAKKSQRLVVEKLRSVGSKVVTAAKSLPTQMRAAYNSRKTPQVPGNQKTTCQEIELEGYAKSPALQGMPARDLPDPDKVAKVIANTDPLRQAQVTSRPLGRVVNGKVQGGRGM